MKLGTIGWGESELSFALLSMPIRAFSDKRTISNFCCMWGGGTPNLQGGAIAAGNGVKVEISACIFQQNEAAEVSADYEVVLKLFPHRRRFMNCPPIGGGGTTTLQGGAIFAHDNVDLKIFSSRFEQNQAGDVSAFLKLFIERLSSQMKFCEISSNWWGGTPTL